MAPTSVPSLYPGAQFPLIVGAPMGPFIATPAFAVAITKAGGLGFMAAGGEREGIQKGLEQARSLAADAGLAADGVLPVGIGFLMFNTALDGVVAAVQAYRPVAVWLFGAVEVGEYATWAEKLREASPHTHIWIQTGTVAEAVAIAASAHPEVLVCQGADAGGHGLAHSAGVISLVPEVADAVAAGGHDTLLVAAGGIADGRSVAAAVALGAVGAAMGTRFLAAHEIELPIQGHEEAILAAADGGPATVRDHLFDDLHPRGNIWPPQYDARAIRNQAWADKRAGASVAEIRERQKEADDAATGPDSRINLWAGTGVGFVTRAQPTAAIVEELRTQTQQALDRLHSMRDGS